MNLDVVYGVDCTEGLKAIPDRSVNFVITSPPYADQRKQTYGGIPADEYIDWFLPIARQISRILTDDGSFMLNIKEHTENGFRNIYTLKLVTHIVEFSKLNLIDTICWTKNGFPGRPYNKLKNGWEPFYHFANNKAIKFRPKRLREPMKASTIKRLEYKPPDPSANGSPMNDNINYDNFKEQVGKGAYPSNVFHKSNIITKSTPTRWHPAIYPIELIEKFVTLCTDEGDIVLDPFLGGGTTAYVAQKLDRHFIGFEIYEPYLKNLREIMGFDVRKEI